MATPTKKSKKGLHILEGVLAGAALAVAAGIFSQTKTGKKLTSDIRDKSAEFYKYLAPQIKKAKQMTEAQYHQLIDASMARYSKAKKLTNAEIRDLKREARSSWSHLKKNLHTGKR